jgi:Flp pilus assembly secretin CpaC
MKQLPQLRRPAGFLLAIWLMAPLLLAALPAPAQTLATSRRPGSVVVPEGRSVMMHFESMRRVQIANPDIADVVISSVAQLALYGKQRGVTSLYVWDRRGLHEYEVTVSGPTVAEIAATDLRKALGNALTYTTVGEDTVIVEGCLPSYETLDRARRVIAARQDPAKILDLVSLEGTTPVAAEAAAAALQQAFGDILEFRILSPDRLVVQGDVPDTELAEQIAKVVAAATNDDLTIVNLVVYNDEKATPPLDKIRAAVGDSLKVWQIKGRTVGVDGTVASQEEYDRLNKVLGTFSEQANVLNLVRVVKPRPDIFTYAGQLQQTFGPEVEVKPMGPETLALQGYVTSKEMREHYEAILDAMDHPYRVVNFLRIVQPFLDQIEVAVLVAEINREDLDKVGVDWGRLTGGIDSIVSMVESPILFYAGSGDGPGHGSERIHRIGAGVDAIRQKINGRLLANPRVMVNDGKEAEILVGGEIPIPVIQPGGDEATSMSIEYRPYGVKLLITPTIMTDGKTLDLAIEPEVSSLDWANALDVSGFRIPALRTRRVSTSVGLENGNTLVLGGLLQREEIESVRKIPLLSQIPIIGELFKHREFTEGETELVIFVTPRIATGDEQRTADEAHPAQQELEEIRQIAD